MTLALVSRSPGRPGRGPAPPAGPAGDARIGAAARWHRRVEWVFGVVSLVLGLSILAALPLAQFLSLGYLLESSARVARTGRLRDGLIGVRRAARVGGVVAGAWLAMVPAWLVASMARSAELIDPGGPGAPAGGWRRPRWRPG